MFNSHSRILDQMTPEWAQRLSLFQKLPFTYYARLGIVAAIALRVVITYNSPNTFRVAWLLALGLLSVYTIIVSIAVVRSPKLQDSERWLVFIVAADTAIFIALLLLTQKADSDIYLILFLPLLIVAESMRGRRAVFSFAAIWLAFVASTLWLGINRPTDTSLLEIGLRDVLPRAVFFVFFLFLVFFRWGILRDQTARIEAVRRVAIEIGREYETTEARAQKIATETQELFKSSSTLVLLRDSTKKRLRVYAATGAPLKNLHPRNTADWLGELLEYDGRKESSLKESKITSSRIARHLPGQTLDTPLIVDGEVIGYIVVNDKSRSKRYAEYEWALVSLLGQHAAIALRNIRLLDQIRNQSRALEALISSGNAMNVSLEQEETQASVAEHAWRLARIYNSDADPLFSCLGLVDKSLTTKITFVATHPPDVLGRIEKQLGRLDVDTERPGIVGKAIKLDRVEHIPNVQLDSEYIEFSAKTRTQLAIPVHGRKGFTGIISIEHPSVAAFPPEIEDSFKVLAAQAAAAIENTQLYQQVREQKEQALSYYNAAVQISEARDYDEICKKLLKSLGDLVKFDRASLQLILDNGSREIVDTINIPHTKLDPYFTRPISEDPLISEILEKRELEVLPVTIDDPRWQLTPSTHDVVTWAGLPLVFRGRSIGLITIDHLAKTDYSTETRRYLNLFRRHAASILKGAMLARENRELIQQLEDERNKLRDTNQYNETLLQYYEDHRNLALIGLVFGETIHYGNSRLGIAATRAVDIAGGRYGQVPSEVQSAANVIVEKIDEYSEKLRSIQEKALSIPEVEPIDLHKTLDQVLASKTKLRERNSHLEPRIKLHRNYELANPHIYAPRQLQQVFYVVIQNALDAMENLRKHNLSLTIRTNREVDDQGNVLIRVDVIDKGRGIPKRDQESIFKPSSSESRSLGRKGTIRGLVWAYSFLRSYGGNIVFETEQGQGTTMSLLFPLDFRLTQGVFLDATRINDESKGISLSK